MSEGSSKGNIAELGEQLKQVLERVQDKYESFIDDAQLFKKGKIDDVNFFYKLSEYLLDLTKANFLEARFVLELKSSLGSLTCLNHPWYICQSSESLGMRAFVR